MEGILQLTFSFPFFVNQSLELAPFCCYSINTTSIFTGLYQLWNINFLMLISLSILCHTLLFFCRAGITEGKL